MISLKVFINHVFLDTECNDDGISFTKFGFFPSENPFLVIKTVPIFSSRGTLFT